MWYPGYQRQFNQMLSPQITFTLGGCVGFMNDSENHPGLVQERHDNIFSDSMDARTRVQSHATANPRYTKTVVKTG
jgi:hypothetical protein